jgi:hypothetical protein
VAGKQNRPGQPVYFERVEEAELDPSSVLLSLSKQTGLDLI